MKKMLKTIVSALLAAVILQCVAFAQEFSDMPDNWTTGALERAVENGLLQGSEGKIMPDDNIKRSEMAAILVRAFGASVEADISMYPDMLPNKWYYSEFAKAVQMGAFSGTDDGKLNPESPITYEECFTVISRIFFLAVGDIADSETFNEIDDSVLNKYSDAQNIANWARKYTALVVSGGYWNGYENKLKPQDKYITRSEFAVLMDNLIKTYVNEPGEYTEFADGNVLIRTPNVIINGYKGDAKLIVGDGVVGEVLFKDVESTNEIIVRGGTNAVVGGVVNDLSAIGTDTSLYIKDLKERTGIIHGDGESKPKIYLDKASVVPEA